MAIVQSNKMIAICHYGGEFETNEDGSVSYGGRETYAVIDDNMHLTDFKQEIAEAIGSAVDGMLLKYFLPGDKKNLITVSKDEDFNQMVNFYKGSDELEVFIMKESSPVKPASRLQKRPAETQVAAILPPDLGSPNIIPPNEAIGIETTNGIANDLIHDHAREQLLESYKDAYNELPLFCEKIMETNPGSVARFRTNEDMSFRRMFVSFHASISGFIQGCRPLLFLHGTPLNSRYQGMLLTATSADGDDRAFPVAFAVVDEENGDNWRWFLSELRTVVLGHESITFVADFQKGLRESLPEMFDRECYHAYCLGYLAEKLNKDLTGHISQDARRLVVEDLYAAAYAPKLEGFKKYTEDIKAISPEAYNWIISSELDHWANAFFVGLRDNHMTSNFGHLFYAWVSEANELSITEMIDELSGKIMQLIYSRRVESSKWLTRLTPSMEGRLKDEILKARSVQVLRSHRSKFEVLFDEIIDIVDVANWDCSCKVWLLTGLPCCHAIAVLETYGCSLYDHCARYFHVEMYQLVYSDSINPIPNLERLMDVELDDGTLIVHPAGQR